MSSIEYKWTDGTMTDAVELSVKLGYYCIDNYLPYNGLNGAICFAKELI